MCTASPVSDGTGIRIEKREKKEIEKMKRTIIILLVAMLSLCLLASCATKAVQEEPKASEVAAAAPAPAAEPAQEQAKEPEKEVAKEVAVTLTVNGTTAAYDSLEAAISAIPDGAEATVTINGDIAVKKASSIKKATVTITDNGKPVTVTDEIEDGDGIQYMFKVEGEGKLIVSPNGGITFKGADLTRFSATRVMFLVGTGYKEESQMSGALEINAGTTLTGIASTSFGGMIRGYGSVVINGGVFKDSVNNKGNGLITLYSKGEINGGEFLNNDSVTVGLIMVTVNCELTINDGTFTGNSGTTSGLMKVNTNATCTINGGTFTGNTAYNANLGAIDATGVVTINGGTFSGNTAFDVVAGNAERLKKADGVVLTTRFET